MPELSVAIMRLFFASPRNEIGLLVGWASTLT